MNKILRFLAVLFTGSAAILMVLFTIQTMWTGDINPAMLDSAIDKLMFISMSIGCALGYGTAAVRLSGLASVKVSQVSFLVSMVFFLSGIYYHMMFGSPL
jgi:hypothetical protein